MTSAENKTLSMRIDKWLWASRFYKTRSLATDEINKARVLVNQHNTKPSKEIKIGDLISIRKNDWSTTVVVTALQAQRGSASQASGMYEETPDSIENRKKLAIQRQFQNEPANGFQQGRPTKQQRRTLDIFLKQQQN